MRVGERAAGELDASTFGVRLRGLRRRVWDAGASKAKSERFKRPLKLGKGAAIVSRLASSAFGGRVLVSAMMLGIRFARIPRLKIGD